MLIRKFETIANTNSALLEESKKSAKSWTVFWTDNQTEGRGYSGASWVSEPGKNVSLSYLLRTTLSYRDLIGYNEWVGLSVCNYIRKFIPETFVKWPNDVIAFDKKLCGILIETRKNRKEMNIVTGIGINVNQSDFKGYPRAGSLFSLTGKEFDVDEFAKGLIKELKKRYHLIDREEWEKISREYEQRLYMKDRTAKFKFGDNHFNGIIRKVDSNGSLVVELEDGELRSFIHKEIEMLY